MEDKNIVAMWGATLITILVLAAAAMGYNGALLLFGVAGVAGLCGYCMEKIIHAFKKVE